MSSANQGVHRRVLARQDGRSSCDFDTSTLEPGYDHHERFGVPWGKKGRWGRSVAMGQMSYELVESSPGQVLQRPWACLAS